MKRKYSNYIDYFSPDGLPVNPWPGMPVYCTECDGELNEYGDDVACPTCGARNNAEYEPDYDAGDDDDDDDDR